MFVCFLFPSYHRKKMPTTVLLEAARRNDVAAVRQLLATEECQRTIDEKDDNGSTALMWATSNNHLDIVTVLVENHADVNLQDDNGTTALMFPATNGHLDVVKVLLDKGADVNMQDKHGSTALMGAAHNGHINVVKVLVDKGADVNLQKKDGTTAVMFPARNGHLDVVKVLVDKGADVNLQTKDGTTAVMFPARNGHLDVVKVLVDKGADVNLQKKDGTTAVMFPARNGHLDVVKVLVDKGADVNLQYKDGTTALMWAATNGHLDAVKVLVDNGAQVNQQNKDGLDPLHCATNGGHQSVVEFLLPLIRRAQYIQGLLDETSSGEFDLMGLLERIPEEAAACKCLPLQEKLRLVRSHSAKLKTAVDAVDASHAAVASALSDARADAPSPQPQQQLLEDAIAERGEATDALLAALDEVRQPPVQQPTIVSDELIEAHASALRAKRDILERRNVDDHGHQQSLFPHALGACQEYIVLEVLFTEEAQRELDVEKARLGILEERVAMEKINKDRRVAGEPQLSSFLSLMEEARKTTKEKAALDLKANMLQLQIQVYRHEQAAEEELAKVEKELEEVRLLKAAKDAEHLSKTVSASELMRALAELADGPMPELRPQLDQISPQAADGAHCVGWEHVCCPHRTIAMYENVTEDTRHIRIRYATFNRVSCVLKRYPTSEQETWQIVEKEIRVKRRVRSSPFVLTPVEAFVDCGYVYLHFEKLTPLGEAVRKQDFDVGSAILDIVRGLQQLHALGVVHGDLKIENAYVRADGVTCIGDFSETVLTRTMTVVRGTTDSIPPELLRNGDGRPTVEGDLYALGVLISKAAHQALPGLAESLKATNPQERPQLTEVCARLQNLRADALTVAKPLEQPLYWAAGEDAGRHKRTTTVLDSMLDGTIDVLRKIDGLQNVKVDDTVVVCNEALWNVYRADAVKVSEDLRSRAVTSGGSSAAPQIPQLPVNCQPEGIASHLDPNTTRLMADGCRETYLFHGTSWETAEMIASGGFDPSYSGASAGALFGAGTYFTDSLDKTSKYVLLGAQDGKGALIVARVVLGNVAHGKDDKPIPGSRKTTLFRRPPALPDEASYDSLCGVNVRGDKAKEYVVYRHTRAYPEFIIRLDL